MPEKCGNTIKPYEWGASEISRSMSVSFSSYSSFMLFLCCKIKLPFLYWAAALPGAPQPPSVTSLEPLSAPPCVLIWTVVVIPKMPFLGQLHLVPPTPLPSLNKNWHSVLTQCQMSETHRSLAEVLKSPLLPAQIPVQHQTAWLKRPCKHSHSFTPFPKPPTYHWRSVSPVLSPCHPSSALLYLQGDLSCHWSPCAGPVLVHPPHLPPHEDPQGNPQTQAGLSKAPNLCSFGKTEVHTHQTMARVSAARLSPVILCVSKSSQPSCHKTEISLLHAVRE